MKKLSKYQRAILDDMQQGAELSYSGRGFWVNLTRRTDDAKREVVSRRQVQYGTICLLVEHGYLRREHQTGKFSDLYFLTDKGNNS